MKTCICCVDCRSIGIYFQALLLESLHDSRPMLGAGSSSGVELFQVFMGIRGGSRGGVQGVRTPPFFYNTNPLKKIKQKNPDPTSSYH